MLGDYGRVNGIRRDVVRDNTCLASMKDMIFHLSELTLHLRMSQQKHIVWKRPCWTHGEVSVGSRDWYGLTAESRSMLQSSAIRLVGEPICVTIGTRSYDVPGAEDQEDLR